MKLHTLTKLRVTHKERDGHEGFLYVHQWPTGFQEVIFANEKLAEQFLAHLNTNEVPAPPQETGPLPQELEDACAS